MIDAMIMAGGKSSRMRKSSGPTHKALVHVRGRSLIEHNARRLLSLGFDHIYLSVSSSEHELLDFIERDLQSYLHQHDARMTVVREDRPLGTIGAAGLVPGDRPLVVVNVDNLTDIDLQAMAEHHVRSRADLTIASHDEPFQIPFGQLRIDDRGRVTDYLEKPSFPVPISSGTYVVGPNAKRHIDLERRTDITSLYASLSKADCKIVAFRHDAFWIDVNDAAGLAKAGAITELDAVQIPQNNRITSKDAR